MSTKRKIALTVNKYSFKEAEDADDKYWQEKSPEYRLKALIDLREMIYGSNKDKSIKKTVYIRSLHEKDET